MLHSSSAAPTRAAGPPARRSRLLRHEARMAYVFITPAMALFLVFTLLPAVIAFFLSFTDYDILTPIRWVGLANYQRLLTDELFRRGVLNVGFYALLYVPLMIALSLSLGLALNRRRPGMALFRTLFYLPAVTSSIAAATVWSWMFQKDYGVVNQALGTVGIAGPNWLASSDTAMYAIVIVTLWQGLGSNIIIYLAGLSGVPGYLYEAAALDGASPLQQFRYITLPALRTTTFFVVFMSLIGAFQLFDQAYVMTQGGPGYATTTAVYQIYSNGFTQLRMGYASAQAFVLAVAILCVSLLSMRLNRDSGLG
ncbi:multiple sugar transport system permease protein [Deinococcus metalli]|uniref:Multiple sugar transport system permease protein n=1 Tax=Deinococcus metalli TaxID=1141878 RepID=A0A7W8KEY8_9DEIO|nr:sugar ABC transporter permease [Deinococcus metalli]MBB5376528.1 multiple sugar transport system permease protein [Deinococcus metalli]GHF43350.1 sugar ABC transporter permease [Deinococcus metalli]